MFGNFGKIAVLQATHPLWAQMVSIKIEAITLGFQKPFWSKESAKPMPRYRPNKVVMHWQSFLSVVFFSTFSFKKLQDAWGWTLKYLWVLSIIFWHILGPTPPHVCASCAHRFNIYLNIIFYAFFHNLRCVHEHWRGWVTWKQWYEVIGTILSSSLNLPPSVSSLQCASIWGEPEIFY